MGQALVDAIAADGHIYAGGVDKDGDLAALTAASDVLVDFSSPHAVEANLDVCVAAGKPIVIGTTGLEERHHFLIDDAARDIAILQTGNTSLGVNMLAALVEQAARQLDADWDIEILEMHHRHKVDAPSGTALLLGEAAAKGRAIHLKDPYAAAAWRATTVSSLHPTMNASSLSIAPKIAQYLPAAQ
jgi:4-hydroxy-tetrahydrodipicolinate reductase